MIKLFTFLLAPTALGPTMTLVYMNKGLTMLEILALLSAIMIGSSILEFPTGILADKIGTKKSLLIESIAELVFILGLFLLPNKLGFVVLVLAGSLHTSFSSSAIFQYMAEYVSTYKPDGEYYKEIKPLMLCKQIGYVSKLALAGFLYQHALQVFYISLTCIAVFKIILATQIPRVELKGKEKKQNISYIEGIKLNIKNVRLNLVVIFSGLFIILSKVEQSFQVVIYQDLNFNIAKLSVLASIFGLMGILAPIVTPKIIPRLKDRTMTVMILGACVTIFPILVLNNIYLVIGINFLWEFIKQFYGPYVNKEIMDMSIKGTENAMLSYKSISKTIFSSVTLMIISYLKVDTRTGLIPVFGTLLSIMIIFLIIYHITKCSENVGNIDEDEVLETV